jgi:alkylhydroperoxidase/carboxymuconolactone decarboxylase family protein YurZ
VTRAVALDDRTCALVRLAALLASGASAASYRQTVADGLAAGATTEDLIDTLRVVAPTVGLARVVTGAPGLALAAGYDIDAALES